MSRSNAAFLVAAGLVGGVCVAAGAAATYMLRADPRAAALVGTGAQWGIYHALALLGVAALGSRGAGGRLLGFSGWCFMAGTLLFSGSLFLLAVTGEAAFGRITPVGGIVLMLAWAALAAHGVTWLRGARGGPERDPPR